MKYIPASEVEKQRDAWLRRGTPDQIGCGRTLNALLASAVELPAPDDKLRGALQTMVDLVDSAREDGVLMHVPDFVRTALEKMEEK